MRTPQVQNSEIFDIFCAYRLLGCSTTVRTDCSVSWVNECGVCVDCASVYMYVDVYVCMHVYMYVYVYVCMCVCMCICIYMLQRPYIVTKFSQWEKLLVLVCILNVLCLFTPSFSMFVTGRTAVSLAGSIKYSILFYSSRWKQGAYHRLQVVGSKDTLERPMFRKRGQGKASLI